MVVKLTSIDQFEKVLNDNPNVFVMKHSSTCPISASAYDQFNKFLYERDMDGYYLIVQEEREYVIEQIYKFDKIYHAR